VLREKYVLKTQSFTLNISLITLIILE